MPSVGHLPDFFTSNSLEAPDLQFCVSLAQARFPNHIIAALPSQSQGACSFTVLCKSQQGKNGYKDAVLQFRMIRHAVSPVIAKDAVHIYGSLAPRVLFCGEARLRDGTTLQTLAMTAIQGRLASCALHRVGCGSDGELETMKRLLNGLATFFVLGWKGSSGKLDGKVGSTIVQRLVWLETGLPKAWLRGRAMRARVAIENGQLDVLPVVLNHGDLLPSNILVDEGLKLVGLVDWAEAEYLPFGMTLYGIEHLLGRMHRTTQERRRYCFEYHRGASSLRRYFWSCLLAKIPMIREHRLWKAMLLSREVGIFLWHGIAWDHGELERVVNEMEDGEELAYLEAMLTSDVGLQKSML